MDTGSLTENDYVGNDGDGEGYNDGEHQEEVSFFAILGMEDDKEDENNKN